MKEKKPKLLSDLVLYIKKNYGVRCKDYAPFCPVCETWRAYDVLNSVWIPLHKLKTKKK